MAIGILAEFNPFHSGHKYLISEVKKRLPGEEIIILMSGDVVQRGELSICDKYERTKDCLKAGADLVLQLPALYTLQGAQEYTETAVEIFDRLKITDHMAFAMNNPPESDEEIRELNLLCDLLYSEPEEYKSELKSLLASGISYPAAVSHAVKKYTKSGLAVKWLESPNDSLAAGYLRAIRKRRSSLEPVIIKRDARYSATSIRKDILENLPSTASDSVRSAVSTDYLSDIADCMLFYRVSGSCRDDRISESDRDLLNRIYKIYREQGLTTISSFISIVKTRNVTYAHIARLMMKMMLTRELKSASDCRIMNLRILGMRRESSHLIAEIRRISDMGLFQGSGFTGWAPADKELSDTDRLARALFIRAAGKALTADEHTVIL